MVTWYKFGVNVNLNKQLFDEVFVISRIIKVEEG